MRDAVPLMTIIRDKRIGCLIWLLCAAAIAALGFWYPSIVIQRHGAPDDRAGVVFAAGFPFYLIGAAIAMVAFTALLGAVKREKMPRIYFVRLIGALLMLFSLSPLLVLAKTFLFKR